MTQFRAVMSVSKKLTKLHGCLPYFPSLSRSYISYSSTSTIPHPSSPALWQHTEEVDKGWKKLLLFIPGAVTFGLGTWQIFRRQEKIKLLDYRLKRLEMEPLRCTQICPSEENLDSLEFRRVLCRGYFDESKSIYLGPRSRSISGVTENGYYLITPLLTIPNDGESVASPVLVNRGWVPRSWRDKAIESLVRDQQVSQQEVPELNSRYAQKGEGSLWWKFWVKKPVIVEGYVDNVSVTEVTGVVRRSEKPSIFVPENDPASSQWFYVDVAAIARACGLSGGVLYVEDVNAHVNPGSPYPVPKDTKDMVCYSVMPRDHLNYSFTWYTLSAAVTYMAFRRVMPKKNRRR